jgi:tetratricopeptide (TPR) repeat protein
VAGFAEASLLFVEEVVNVDPSYQDIYFLRGFGLQKMGRLEEAVISYQRQLARSPQDSQSLFNLGHAQLTLGRPAQAISSFLEVLRLDPGRNEAHYHLASCYGALGDATRAAEHAARYQQAALTAGAPAATDKQGAPQ